MKPGLRAAIVIAHYGTKNVLHLDQVLYAWEHMPRIRAEITVLTGKDLPAGAAPASLPFLARPLLADKFRRRGEYDLFVYSEDDMLVTSQNLLAWSKLTPTLRPNEVAGFLRYEVDSTSGERRFPDLHGGFQWKNVEQRKGETFAEFSNAHQGCYLLTPLQMRIALETSGFLVPAHADATYGMLERGASDPFLQCGLRRVIPLSRFADFLIEHLPANYLHMGKPEAAVRAELKGMGVEWR